MADAYTGEYYLLENGNGASLSSFKVRWRCGYTVSQNDSSYTITTSYLGPQCYTTDYTQACIQQGSYSLYLGSSCVSQDFASSSTQFDPFYNKTFTPTKNTWCNYTMHSSSNGSYTFTKTKEQQTIYVRAAQAIAALTASYYDNGLKTKLYARSINGTNVLTLTIPAKPSYTVTYNSMGGSSVSSQVKWYGETLSLTLPTPTRTGYDFAGWYTTSNYSGSRYTNTSYTANSALTLYAKWTPHTYTVSFASDFPEDDPDRQGSMEAQPFTYGTSQALSTCGFTCQEYDFVGWSTTVGGQAIYTNGQSVSNLTSTQGGTVTLHAIWKCNHVNPTITSFNFTRCDEDKHEQDEGEYMHAVLTCNVNDDDYSGGTLYIRYKEANSPDDWTQVEYEFQSGRVIEVDERIGEGEHAFSTEMTYLVQAVFVDGFNATAAISDILTQAYYTIDVKAGGKGISFGAPATEDGFKVAMDAQFTGDFEIVGADKKVNALTMNGCAIMLDKNAIPVGIAHMYTAVERPSDAAIASSLNLGLMHKPYVLFVSKADTSNTGVHMDEG